MSLRSFDKATHDPRVAIIILNWNGLDDTIACLQSVSNVRYNALEIIVVDNGSSDGSVETIHKIFPEVQIVANASNLGFAEGNNVGIRQALDRTDYILLLNNDTTVHPDILHHLIPVVEEDPSIAVAGPVICYETEPDTIWCAGLQMGRGRMYGLSLSHTTSVLMYCGQPTHTVPEKIYTVDAIVGCAMLMRTSVLQEIGFLASELFMIHEDFDWSLRAQEAGYRCVVIPIANVWHKVSVSINRQDQQRSGNPSAEYYWYRNWLLVMRKHYGRRAMLMVALLYAFKLFPALFFQDITKRRFIPSVWKAHWLALIDALVGRHKKRFVR
jgi:GT2 family glycosyltransferase